MKSWGVFFFLIDVRDYDRGTGWCFWRKCIFAHRVESMWNGGGRKIKAEWVFESLTVQSLTRRQICMCHFFAIWQVKPPYFFKGVSGRGLFFCFFLILFVVIHNLNVFFMLFNQTHNLCQVSSETFYCLFCTENLSISPSNCGTLDRLLLRTRVLHCVWL